MATIPGPWRSRETTGRSTRPRSSPGWTPHYGTTSPRLRDRQLDGIAHAYTALNLLPAGAAAICVLAALAVAAGITPRLSEYH